MMPRAPRSTLFPYTTLFRSLLGAVGAYALWASLARGKLEIRGWALRAPGAAIGLTQILLGVADLSLSSAVLWSLLPAGAHIGFVSFLGIYAAAVIAGVVSHAPGGVGVSEAVMLLALPGIPPEDRKSTRLNS